jgi:hypothetical protein
MIPSKIGARGIETINLNKNLKVIPEKHLTGSLQNTHHT